jgi:uncharacterized damage-inducible protein DinB
MDRYNGWQNQSQYGAADQLTGARRKVNEGAFFGAIRGRLGDILFGDKVWLWRVTGDETIKPVGAGTYCRERGSNSVG